MYAPDSALPVGLIEQQRWSRATDTYGVKHQRKERPYEEKKVTAGSRLRSAWPNGWGRYRNG
ncbi:hypothetical protein ECDEC1E_5322 [Escherichia coli DEC1E]|nr:hypothetical protein ECDEC1E_5322 [Escherichia coli DEC1E]